MQTINIETNQQDDYQVRESYRNLRTNIFLRGKDPKVVMRSEDHTSELQ